MITLRRSTIYCNSVTCQEEEYSSKPLSTHIVTNNTDQKGTNRVAREEQCRS